MTDPGAVAPHVPKKVDEPLNHLLTIDKNCIIMMDESNLSVTN
jgi:hypothetical protein